LRPFLRLILPVLPVLGLAAPAAARPLAAQGADSTGTLRGRVTDAATGGPVTGATVRVVGAPIGTLTGDDGRYEVRAIPAGPRTIEVRLLGYATETRQVTLRAGATVTLDVALRSSAAELQAVRVVSRPPENERFLRSPDPGTFALTGQAARRVPVIGEPDVLRVVQLLPGVVSTSDFNAGYNVRGGESDQNLVLLDGYPIYNPFHLGGLFGTFIDETVGGFELLPGGFPARYGTRLSSVLAVAPRAEERAGVHGSVTLSLLASTASLGGARNDGRTSWNVAARRTYADRFVALLTDDQLPYWFTDAQAHLRHRFAGGGTLSATLYGGSDVLAASLASFGDTTQAGGGALRFDWGNTVAGMAFEQPLEGVLGGDSARVMQRLSHTGFGTTLDLGSGSLRFVNRLRETRAWGEVTRWQGRHELLAGYEWSAYRMRYTVDAAQAGTTGLLDSDRRPSALSVYLDDTWRASDRLLLRTGLRGETVTGTGWAGLSPRLSAKWFASPTLAFTAAGGVTTQWTPALRNEQAPVRVFDFWLTADRNTPVAKATQLIAGVERWLDGARFVRVEAYHKRYDRLPASNLANDPRVRGDEFIATTGSSYGMDVLVRQLESRRLSGWLAYSLAWSVREGPEGRFAPVQDRRHNLNVVASWRPGGKWSYGARLGVGTGVPYTDIVGQVVRRRYDPVTNSFEAGSTELELEPVGGPRNGVRFPLFQRLDVSATRTSTGRARTWAPYVSLINAYNARNVFTYIFDYAKNPPTKTAFSQFPILPTVGVAVSW
jgi:hypothetical protein